MKKKIIRFLKVAIFCTVCVLCNACSCMIGNPGEDVYYQDVKVINKSGETIYAADFMFGDTTLLTPKHVFKMFDPRILREAYNDSCFIGKIAIPETEDEANSLYQVIIFKQSTIDKYSKEELIEKNIFDKRYLLNYNELKKVNFKMTYSGD